MPEKKTSHSFWEHVAKTDGWGRLQRHMNPCFVGFGWSDQKIVSGEGSNVFEQADVRHHLFSGFIAEFNDRWVYITAGHIASEISKAESVGRRTFRFEFVDGFHRPDHKTEHVPISYNQEEWLIIDEPDKGVDIAIHPLSFYERELLAAAGVQAMPIISEDCTIEDCDGFGVVGMPKELVDIKVKDTPGRREVYRGTGLPMLPVEIVEQDIAPEMSKDGRRFVGRILSLEGTIEGAAKRISSIVGMSGGPVFGFKLEKNKKSVMPILVGVQSVWLESQRLIGVTKTEVFFDYLVKFYSGEFSKNSENTEST